MPGLWQEVQNYENVRRRLSFGGSMATMHMRFYQSSQGKEITVERIKDAAPVAWQHILSDGSLGMITTSEKQRDAWKAKGYDFCPLYGHPPTTKPDDDAFGGRDYLIERIKFLEKERGDGGWVSREDLEKIRDCFRHYSTADTVTEAEIIINKALKGAGDE